MASLILVTGFAPFGGERINPSWEVARALDGEIIEGLTVKAIRTPVNCAQAAARVSSAVVRLRPRAFLGLGQAGGRAAISLERVAINLFQNRNGGKLDTRDDARVLVNGGPDAYLARLPFGAILKTLRRRRIPAAISLSAGAYACNATMYAALHALRRRPGAPAGFIHLPYDAAQAARHPESPSMSLEVMERAVRLSIAIIAGAAAETGRPRQRRVLT
jgi:pyroglutamyl-peptidase